MELNKDIKLSKMEEDRVKDIIRGLVYAEKKYALTQFPLTMVQEEVNRRSVNTLAVMKELFDILSKVQDDLGTVELMIILRECRELLKDKED